MNIQNNEFIIDRIVSISKYAIPSDSEIRKIWTLTKKEVKKLQNSTSQQKRLKKKIFSGSFNSNSKSNFEVKNKLPVPKVFLFYKKFSNDLNLLKTKNKELKNSVKFLKNTIKKGEIIPETNFFGRWILKYSIETKIFQKKENFKWFLYIDEFGCWTVFLEEKFSVEIFSKENWREEFDKIYSHKKGFNKFNWINPKKNNSIIEFLENFLFCFYQYSKKPKLSWEGKGEKQDINFTTSIVKLNKTKNEDGKIKNILDDEKRAHILDFENVNKKRYLNDNKLVVSNSDLAIETIEKKWYSEYANGVQFHFSYKKILLEIEKENEITEIWLQRVKEHQISLNKTWAFSFHLEEELEDLFKIISGERKKIEGKKLKFLSPNAFKIIYINSTETPKINDKIISAKLQLSKLDGIVENDVSEEVLNYYKQMVKSSKIHTIFEFINEKQKSMDIFKEESAKTVKFYFNILSLSLLIIYTSTQFAFLNR